MKLFGDCQLGAFLLAFITGCSAGGPIKGEPSWRWDQEAVWVGRERIVEKSHQSLPDWILKLPSDKEVIYFVGASTDAKSLSTGRNIAYMNALLELIRSFGSHYLVEGGSTFTESQNFLRQSIKGVPIVVIAGSTRLEELYYQKKEVIRKLRSWSFDRGDIETTYDVFIKLQIPRGDWVRYKQQMDRQ